MLEEAAELTNSYYGPSESQEGTNGRPLVNRALRSTKQVKRVLLDLYAQKPIVEITTINIAGEFGTGGRPFKKKPENPYLEIDLIDPTDPILFEGEIQKYKPGFKACFIDRWV